MTKVLGDLTVEQRHALINRLSAIDTVRQYDKSGEPQAATLVHSLTDLEQSFFRVIDDLIPRLQDESLTADQLNDVLHGIGEELRHVLYHVRDPEYFSYLFGEDRH